MPNPNLSLAFPTLVQLLKVIRYEPPWFIGRFFINLVPWFFAKFILRRSHLTKEIHGFKMRLSLADAGISRSLLLVGDREREQRFILERVLAPASLVLDLGANLGYYVLLELKNMPRSGRVIAIEPSPDNYLSLVANLQLNGAGDRVEAIQAAVADTDGETYLYQSKLSNVHSLIASNTPQPTGSRLRVPAISLATLNRRFPGLKLIRMDIEGYEVNLLRSLLNLNRTAPFLPDLLFELHPPKYDRPVFLRLLDDLFASGYRAKYLATSHLDLIQQYQLTKIASLPTDGQVRHIAADVDLPSLKALVFNSRAIFLTTNSSLHRLSAR